MPEPTLDAILQRPDIWQSASHRQADGAGVATGFEGLDACLHLGGWPRAGLIELLLQREGIGEYQLLLPTLARLSRRGEHTLLLSPPHIPYPPALVGAGIDPDRILVVESERLDEQLWCAEQALLSGAAACVIGWLDGRRPSTGQLRKLLLSSRQGDGLLFLYRHGSLAVEASPARLRLQLTPAMPGGLQVDVLKQPGGWSGQTVTLPRRESWLEASLWHLPLSRHLPPEHRAGTAAAPASPAAPRQLPGTAGVHHR